MSTNQDFLEEAQDRAVYLAGPYSHKHKDIEAVRRILLTYVSTKLAVAGITVFSPITQSHEQERTGLLKGDYATWQKTDRKMVEKMDEMWVLVLDGWKQSVGVTDEIQWARRKGKKIRYIKYQAYQDKIIEVKRGSKR